MYLGFAALGTFFFQRLVVFRTFLYSGLIANSPGDINVPRAVSPRYKKVPEGCQP